MHADPFGALGLSSDASVDEVRDARRRLAKEHHPDRGGDAGLMGELNDAADAALRRLAEPMPTLAGQPPGRTMPDEQRPDGQPSGEGRRESGGAMRDTPSFTVEALPAETFEALVIVASWYGEVLDDEPPYRLDLVLGPPIRCWCRLDLVPDAGATTVSITIGAVGDDPLPEIEVVRDIWVDGLNRLDWDEHGPSDPR